MVSSSCKKPIRWRPFVTAAVRNQYPTFWLQHLPPRESGNSFLHWSAVSPLILFLRVSTLNNCHSVSDMICMPCYIIQSFKAYTSIVFSMVTDRYLHHHNQFHNTSITSKRNLYPLAIIFPALSNHLGTFHLN